MNDETLGAYRIRAAVIEKAWSDLNVYNECDSAFAFFMGERFVWWSGGGHDLSAARERARRIFEKTKASHLEQMRADLLNPKRVDRALEFFRSAKFARVYGSDLDVGLERNDAESNAVPPQKKASRAKRVA